MNWYNKIIFAQSLTKILEKPEVQDDVKQFIYGLPKDQLGPYIKTLKMNPAINLNVLQMQIQQIPKSVPKQQINPYYPHEKQLAFRFPVNAQKWALAQLKQARNNRLDYDPKYINSVEIQVKYPELESYSRMKNMFERWINTNELVDFLRAYPNFQIGNYSPDDMEETIIEWHHVQSGKGAGKLYEPTKQEFIVYGPQWENKEFNGWTIQEVRSTNDLQVEGNKQDHCVGGDDYCKGVDKGTVKIFSLRDPKNYPHVTIESDPGITIFNQIMGKSNSEPKSEYREMIKEWVMSLGHDVSDGYETNPIRDVSSSESDPIETVNEQLHKMFDYRFDFERRDEYGRKEDISIDVDDYEYLIDFEKNKKRNRYSDMNYTGSIQESPELFVNALVSKYGYPVLDQLEESLQKYEEQNDFYDNWNYDYNVEPQPDPKDYESDELYEKAMEEWQEKESEYESQAIDEARSQWLPWGFIDDMFRYINRYRQEVKGSQRTAMIKNLFRKTALKHPPMPLQTQIIQLENQIRDAKWQLKYFKEYGGVLESEKKKKLELSLQQMEKYLISLKIRQ